LASGLVRISIACSLLRIAIDRINKVTLYAICILNSLNTMPFLFFASFQCVPVSGFWENRQDASCVDATVVVEVTYLYSAISSACDLALGILPIALVWHLSMSWRYKKVALCCFLGAGSLYVHTTSSDSRKKRKRKKKERKKRVPSNTKQRKHGCSDPNPLH
jgi:hypothetical protein